MTKTGNNLTRKSISLSNRKMNKLVKLLSSFTQTNPFLHFLCGRRTPYRKRKILMKPLFFTEIYEILALHWTIIRNIFHFLDYFTENIFISTPHPLCLHFLDGFPPTTLFDERRQLLHNAEQSGWLGNTRPPWLTNECCLQQELLSGTEISRLIWLNVEELGISWNWNSIEWLKEWVKLFVI